MKDRGAIKWQGMLLPEHTKEINAWRNGEQDSERPQLDEWDLQALQSEIELAYKRQCITVVKLWDKGKVIVYSGVITDIHSRTVCISIDSPSGRKHMPIVDILSVQIAE